MSDEDRRSLDDLSRLISAEHRGVRVFWAQGESKQELVDSLAMLLGEYMHEDDELHVTYNAMQSGWQNHPPSRSLIRGTQPGHTELHFEYSAFVVLRPRSGGLPRPEDE